MQIFQCLFIVECLALWFRLWETRESQLNCKVSLCTFKLRRPGYLIGGGPQGIPVNPRNNVANELWLEFLFLLLQLCIVEM